jgi:hypothetical protein
VFDVSDEAMTSPLLSISIETSTALTFTEPIVVVAQGASEIAFAVSLL